MREREREGEKETYTRATEHASGPNTSKTCTSIQRERSVEEESSRSVAIYRVFLKYNKWLKVTHGSTGKRFSQALDNDNNDIKIR